jgi:hypothetical protein
MVAMTAVGDFLSFACCFVSPQSLLICQLAQVLVPSVLNPVVVNTANTPMNRIPRRLDENICQFAGVGSAAALGRYEGCWSAGRLPGPQNTRRRRTDIPLPLQIKKESSTL